MIFRVIMTIGYNEAYFDFDDIKAASDFAQIVLNHQIETKDAKKQAEIKILVIKQEDK